jgi:S1-C subfamily serine protease
MKVGATLLVGVTIFAAVLGALRLNHYLDASANHVVAAKPMLLPSPTVESAVYSSDPAEGTLDFRAAAKKVIPSVVSVERYEQVVDFFGYSTNQIRETASGSGVIIGADGLIVTNNHVVADENGNAVPQVKVKLNDHRTFTAKVIGTDPRADLAVLKISGDNLAPAEIGSSASLQVGQWVMAVGNPLGFDDTVTVGVVSSLKRDLPIGQRGLTNAIQTDASINPGNSGGALCDQHGKLIGINSAIASSNGGSVGIGFAIPVDRVQVVVNDIIKFGHVRYASLGVEFYPNAEGALGDERARQYIAEQTGAPFQSVPSSGLIIGNAAGPAAKAGLGQWDILLAVDGTPVDSYFSVNRVLGEKKPFEKATVKWWSRGQTKTATVTLQESGGPTQ